MTLQKVVINGVAYIGKLKDGENGLVLEKAMKCQDVNRNALGAYLKAKNLDELETVQFGGAGVAYSVSDLSDDETMELDMLQIAMKSAKRKAAKGLENNVFDSYLGK